MQTPFSTPSPSSQRRKNRLPLYAGAGCGALLLLALSCTAVILLYFFLNPFENEISLGTLEIGASGGTFEKGDLRLEYPPGIAPQTLRFEVLRERRAPPREEEGLTYRSVGYTLRGPLHLLEGEIRISLKVPQTRLDESGSQLVLEEDVYTPSYGVQRVTHLLPTVADPTAGTLNAVLVFEPMGSAGDPSPDDIFPVQMDTAALPQQSQNQPGAITIRAETGRRRHALVSDHFRVIYMPGIHDAGAVEQGVRILEEQYQKLTDMGFTLADTGQIDVYIRVLKDDKSGQFISSRLGASYCSLELDSHPFYSIDDFNQNIQEVKATAGHELMHLAQFIADPRWAYSKAINPLPTLWLDEAVATWFEPWAVGNLSFLPSQAVQNAKFINTPLYGADLSTAQDHGYGASMFIRFLTDRYGTDLVSEIYRELPETRSGTAAEAFDRALRKRDILPGIEYLEFLETYHLNPQRLNGFINPDIPPYTTVVTAVGLTESGDATVEFRTNPALNKIASTQSGLLSGTKPATLRASFSLGGLSATALQISIRQDDVNQKIFSQPAQLSIAVAAPQNVGVLVYGAGSNGKLRPLAGATFDYLSSGDPFSQKGDRLLVENFSLDGTAGSYKTLLLVPFNIETSSFTSGEPVRQIDLQITLWGQIVPIGETPTPVQDESVPPPTEVVPAPPPTATAPVSESDHACAGMTVEQMRQPSVLNRRCWIACFGIDSQVRPSDAEIQECIDKHQ